MRALPCITLSGSLGPAARSKHCAPVGSAGRSWRHGRAEQPGAAAPNRPRAQPGLLPRRAGAGDLPRVRQRPGAGHGLLLGWRVPGTVGPRRRAAAPPAPGMALWLQVRELAAVRRELGERGVRILREPKREPWGLLEMWIADPDGVRICIVEIPEEHPLRRRG